MATLLPEGKQSFTDSEGKPLVGGKVYTYDAGTSSPRPTYADAAGTVPNTNPIILDARGEATIFWSGAYKVVLKDAADNTVWTTDGVSTANANNIPADDGAGGTLWTTVAGFIVFLMSSLGASILGFIQAGVGSVARSIQSKLRDSVSVADFMTPEQIADVTAGTLTIDVTSAVQAAINTGKSIDWLDGNHLCGPITVPASAAGATYRGKGFWHYGKTKKTRFTARDTGQAHIFKLANSADNITFELMRLDCEDKCAKGIDGEFGAFLSLDAVGVYGATEWGIYNKQGLARWRRLFVRCDNATGGGAHLYSDGSIESSEFTRGRVPLRLAAGGNRLTNVWASGGTECCVELAPFDASTNHINTSITCLYAGETNGGATTKPIIKIAGNATRRVEQVQIAASHLVCAETATDKINIGIDCTYARDVAITGLTVLGFTTPTVTKQLQHFVRADNTLNLSINGNVVRNCTKNLIVVGANCYPVNIAGNTFSEYATSVAAGTEGAAILIDNNTSYGAITGNIFDISSASTVPYAAEGGSATRWVFDDNLLRYASATVWNPATGVLAGGFQRMGSQPVPRGQLGGSAPYDPPSLVDGAGVTTTVVITGAALGDAVTAVSFLNDLQGITLTAWVSAANTVSVRFQNETGGTLDLTSGTLRIRVMKLV